MTLPQSSWSFVVAGLALSACSSAPDHGATTTQPDAGDPTPTIRISSPADGDSIVLTASPDIEVRFAVTHFTLKDPSFCLGATACGHVNVVVDGTECNDVDVGYNHTGSSSPIDAGMDYCPPNLLATPRLHTITLELHYDDATDSPVLDANRQNIADSIMLMVDYRYTDPGDGGMGDAAADAPRADASGDGAMADSGAGDGATQDGPSGDPATDAGDTGPASDANEQGDDGTAPDTGPEAAPSPDAGASGDGSSATDATTVDAGPG